MDGDGGRREIDHTADLGFEVWAADLEGLYAEALRGLLELCFDRAAVEPRQARRLEASGASEEERLVTWLQEAYLLLEIDGWLAADVDDVELGEDAVRGTVRGEPLDRGRHTLHTEIKAVTYHDMDVRRDADGMWRTTVIVDV